MPFIFLDLCIRDYLKHAAETAGTVREGSGPATAPLSTVLSPPGAAEAATNTPTGMWASRRDRTKRIEIQVPPPLSLAVATLVFAVSIVLLYLCIDATVDSISALTEQTSPTSMFVRSILLPIPDCDFAPISPAADDFFDQTMRYTVGRSVQTALLVEPLVVLLAWWMGKADVTLAFYGFEVISLFTTILLLGFFLMVDAKVHWVHGILLMNGLYLDWDCSIFCVL